MPEQKDWPRRCPSCGKEHFRNPLPVAVVLVGIQEGGVLTVRRAISPAVGQLALPGGYVNWGESWQQAASREVLEETGLSLAPESLELLTAVSVREGNLLLFCSSPPQAQAQVEWSFCNPEVSQLVRLETFQELAFPTHTEILRSYFERIST
jgi:8-oxo-dGTP pyrophosphatase MutT (NUDIX family)